MKKLIAFALMLAMLVSVLPLSVFAADEIKVQTYIEAVFDDAGSFSDGFAAVKVDGKWGYINETGEFVIAPRYDAAGPFSEGVAVVGKIDKYEGSYTDAQNAMYYYLVTEKGQEIQLKEKNGNWWEYDVPDPEGEGPGGYDKSKMIVPASIVNYEDEPVEDFAKWIHGRLQSVWAIDGAVVLNGTAFRTDGSQIWPESENKIPSSNPWDTESFVGEDIYASQYVWGTSGPCVNGVLSMYYRHPGNSDIDYRALCTVDGKILREIKVDSKQFWVNDVFAPDRGGSGLSIVVGETENGFRAGAIDANNNWVIPPVYEDYYWLFNGTYFQAGMMSVKKDGKWGTVDKTGKTVLPFVYDHLSIASETDPFLAKKDGKWTYIDTTGKVYPVIGLDGKTVEPTLIGSFNSSHFAVVYVKETDTAFIVKYDKAAGTITAIPGSDKLDKNIYFSNSGSESDEALAVYGLTNLMTIVENGKYGFAKVTYGDEELVPIKPVFTDVDPNQYYAEPVAWAVENGITNGTSKTTFSPDDPCTRAQIVTFLWRAMGSPEPASAVNPFSDVKAGEYYYKAVLWAVEKGITTGTSKTTFSPDDPCTRGQVVTFQYRAKGKPAVSGTCAFSDVVSSEYYYDAVIWAVAGNITTGTTKTTFSPDDTCTRGQIVTFLFRDLAKLPK